MVCCNAKRWNCIGDNQTRVLSRYLSVFLIIGGWAFVKDVHAEHRHAVKHGSAATPRIECFDVVDLSFESDRNNNAPTDIELTVALAHESGVRMDVPGFYDGEGTFVVRFCPSRAGVWKYETSSPVSSLDDKSGELNVQVAEPTRKAPIIIKSDDPTHFYHADGQRYFPIAFECDWLFALDVGNPDGIPKTKQLVDMIAENGFNQVVMNVYAHDVEWEKDKDLDPQFDYGNPDLFPFAGTNGKPDHSTLNIEFFQRLDRVLDYLDEKEIVAHLMIYVWNKQVNWPDAESEADNRYFDYVVRRYQAYPNLIWDVSKEALGYGHNDVHYITRRIERLRKLDVHDRLVTVHAYNYCQQFPEQVDFVSVQTWESELCRLMQKIAAEFPKKPILNIEHGGYERGPYTVFNGNYTSPETCLERAYRCVFAGTYPTHYWQGSAWNVVIPDIDSLQSKQRPKFEYYKHLRDFVDKYEVEKLIVGQKKSNAGFSLHNGEDFYIFFVPAECEFLNLRPRRDLGQTMKLQWLDPRTGTYGDAFSIAMTRWPFVEVPESDGFQILFCQLVDSAASNHSRKHLAETK